MISTHIVKKRRTRVGALLALIICAAIVSRLVPAQVRQGVAGQFDYYLLSLAWAPEFCAQPDEAARNPQECVSGRNIGFIVLGLWPEAEQGNGPESCGQARSVSKGIVNSMLGAMLSPGLIQHEWATHGTCSGLNVSSYFTTVLLARAAVQIPVQISSLTEQVTESPSQIEGQFVGTNPAFPKDGFRIACRNGALTEVRACFDKNLKPRQCSSAAGECRTASIAIRPPR